MHIESKRSQDRRVDNTSKCWYGSRRQDEHNQRCTDNAQTRVGCTEDGMTTDCLCAKHYKRSSAHFRPCPPLVVVHSLAFPLFVHFACRRAVVADQMPASSILNE